MKNKIVMNNLRSCVEKTTAVWKKGHDGDKSKVETWFGKRSRRRKIKGGKVESGAAQRKREPAGSSGGQSSVDVWEHAKPQGKWTEVSADCRVLGALVKEKKRKLRGRRVAKKAQKREADLYDMLEKAVTNEKREEKDRDKLGHKFEAFLSRNKKVLGQSSLCKALRELCRGIRQRSGPSQDPDDKMLAIDESRGTMNLNSKKTCTPGKWAGMKKTRRPWAQDEGDEQKGQQP